MAMAPAAAAAPPVVFFSDLDWGPKTGWEGSATKGAAVSIWGLHFGESRGTSYVTVNGARLIAGSDYAEWGVTGPARGLQRITFWLNSSCADGNGTISVTVGGVSSATIPFRVSAGAIYFISPSGSNGNSGLTTSSAWRDIAKFNPGNNPSGDGQYIVYVRAGTYTGLDVDEAFIALRGPYGSDSKRKALVGYPGEVPVLNCAAANAGRGVVWNANYEPYGRNSYFTYSKLKIMGAGIGIDLYGDYIRVVGNQFVDNLAPDWTGVVMIRNSRYARVHGNMFNHNGATVDGSYKHNVYILSTPLSVNVDTEEIDVGWNEFKDAEAGSDSRGGVIFARHASDATTTVLRNVSIHDNYFHGGNQNFIEIGDAPSQSNFWIFNNVFEGGYSSYLADGVPSYNPMVYLAWNTSPAYVYNNTFYLTGRPDASPLGTNGTGGGTRVFSSNNIFYAHANQPFFDIFQGSSLTSDRDLFHRVGGSTALPTVSGLTRTNSLTGDPLFAAAATGNYRLQAGSPAVNTGLASVSSVVTRGYDGVPRPQGSGFDLGAFERDERVDAGEIELTGYALPQIAFGGNPAVEGRWSTSLYFTNTGAATASFTIDFHANNGAAMAVPSQGGTSASIQVVVSAGATSRIELSSTGALTQGWASVRMPATVKGFGIFRQSVNDRQDQEAVVPMTADSTQSHILIWDDAGFTTSIAVANPGDTPVTVNLSVRLANGSPIGTGTINLGPKAKQAFVIRQQLNLPVMQGTQGSLAVSVSSGSVSVLGLRFGGVAFTSMPPAGI
jgi:hypothetical protein